MIIFIIANLRIQGTPHEAINVPSPAEQQEETNSSIELLSNSLTMVDVMESNWIQGSYQPTIHVLNLKWHDGRAKFLQGKKKL